MKTLHATDKDFKKAFKQLKRWFTRNPNRKVVLIKLDKKEIRKVNRQEILK